MNYQLNVLPMSCHTLLPISWHHTPCVHPLFLLLAHSTEGSMPLCTKDLWFIRFVFRRPGWTPFATLRGRWSATRPTTDIWITCSQSWACWV